MEGVEFVGQSRHEAVVVIDHTKEAMKAGLPSENEEVIPCLHPEGVTFQVRMRKSFSAFTLRG